jgi:hypothetical protein
MTLVKEILVESLAFTDALFSPTRRPMAEHWAAVWVLRWRFGRDGLPWRGGGDKEHERALTEAVRAGWIVRRRASRKTIGVRLTPTGMQEGWRLIGIRGDAAARALEEVNRWGRGRQWVAEIAFTRGNKGWGDGHSAELLALEYRFLPALTVQWIESNSDVAGRLGYRVTEAGKEALSTRQAPANGRAAGKKPADPAAVHAYDKTYMESVSWLHSQTNVSVGCPGEIGPIPLSASIWHTACPRQTLSRTCPEKRRPPSMAPVQTKP